MPNRRLQAMKNVDYCIKHNVHFPARRRLERRLLSRMRIPSHRMWMRNEMMDRLRAEVRAKEVNALLDQQEHGVSKPKRVRKKKAVTE